VSSEALTHRTATRAPKLPRSTVRLRQSLDAPYTCICSTGPAIEAIARLDYNADHVLLGSAARPNFSLE
jgi:hypothetical protein